MNDNEQTLTLAARGLLTMLRGGYPISAILQRTPGTPEAFDAEVTRALDELSDAGLLMDLAVME